MEEFNFQSYYLKKKIDSIKESLVYVNANNDKIDKITIWLVGFAVTAITLTIAGYNSGNTLLLKTDRVIITFSSLIVFFGLLTRVYLVIFQKHHLDMIYSFDQFISEYCMPENTKYTRHVSELNDTIDSVTKHLENDFGIVINSEDLKSYSNQKDALKFLIETYRIKQKETIVINMNFYNDILTEHIGKKYPKITMKDFDLKEGVQKNSTQSKVWTYVNLINLAFKATCFIFTIGIISIVIMYFLYT